MNRIKVHFENGFSASIIEGDGSYGLELATIDKDGNIIGEPEGWLNGERLIRRLTNIKEL